MNRSDDARQLESEPGLLWYLRNVIYPKRPTRAEKSPNAPDADRAAAKAA